jgi:hypothetical protein
MQKKLKMHAVSMTPHARRTVHAVSFAPHAKYGTACTIDKRFERPWQPLKGISIKNIYVLELSYPTSKKIYKFKGAT